MCNLFFLIISSIALLNYTDSDFAVDVQFVRPANTDSILLKIEVKNLSAKAVKLPNPRLSDYKREKIRAFGNYIIEIEKLETDGYKLFSPSADMDQLYLKPEYFFLEKGNRIADTIFISGRSFARAAEPKRGFPRGDYRLKISFNPDEWSDNQANTSDWLSFKIDN